MELRRNSFLQSEINQRFRGEKVYGFKETKDNGMSVGLVYVTRGRYAVVTNEQNTNQSRLDVWSSTHADRLRPNNLRTPVNV